MSTSDLLVGRFRLVPRHDDRSSTQYQTPRFPCGDSFVIYTPDDSSKLKPKNNATWFRFEPTRPMNRVLVCANLVEEVEPPKEELRELRFALFPTRFGPQWQARCSFTRADGTKVKVTFIPDEKGERQPNSQCPAWLTVDEFWANRRSGSDDFQIWVVTLVKGIGSGLGRKLVTGNLPGFADAVCAAA